MERQAPNSELRVFFGETRRRGACKWKPAVTDVRFNRLDVHADASAEAALAFGSAQCPACTPVEPAPAVEQIAKREMLI